MNSAGPEKIVLASASPRRRDLLRAYGWDATMLPPRVQEITPPHFTPGETTLFNAILKAANISAVHPRAVVIGADTLVSIDGAILGKPSDLNEARRMLRKLSGRTHEVFTGVCLMRALPRKTVSFVEMSSVRIRKLSETEIREYLGRIEPLDKAGAYAAQKNEMNIIAAIEGSRTNVIGLPMERLARALAEFGALSLRKKSATI